MCSFVHNIVNHNLYLLHKNIISMLRLEYLRQTCTFILIISYCKYTHNRIVKKKLFVIGLAIQLELRYSQSLKPCKLQKSIPNHQYSFCWIYLPLLTLSIIRSSCPPSHHWTSLGFHFAGLNPISLVGLSRWPGEGRYPKHINWLLV